MQRIDYWFNIRFGVGNELYTTRLGHLKTSHRSSYYYKKIANLMIIGGYVLVQQLPLIYLFTVIFGYAKDLLVLHVSYR